MIDTPEAILKTFARRIETWEITGVNLQISTLRGAAAELRLKARRQKALLSVRPLLHPSRKTLADPVGSGDGQFIIVSPHIPDDLASDYRKAAINHADLNGRIFIQTPWLLLDREPKGSGYRNPVSEPDLFSLKTSRLPRALLSDRDRTWSQGELDLRTQLSRGLISRILNELTLRGYVTRESKGTRHAAAAYRLADFDRLLDAWRAADVWRKRVAIQEYSLLTNDPKEIARAVRDALGAENIAFTQWFAAYLRHPYTTPPLVSAYVRSGLSLPELRFARPAPNGGNLWLIAPKDEGVFFETQECDGFGLVSDVQIYLDLVHMEQRGPDAAEALRAWDGFFR
jgi:hypothetical protein